MKRPFYTRIALVGIAMYLFIEVVILAAILAFQPSEWAYPLIVGGLVLAGGVAIYLWHPWGLVVGSIGGLIGIMFSLDGMGENLSSPDSFLDFAFRPVIWLGGTLLLLGGSSVGLVQHFRGRTGSHGPVLVKRAVQSVVALVAVVSAVSAILTVAGISTVSAREETGAATVGIHAIEFRTTSLTVPARAETKFVLENDDPIVHTFTVDGLDIDVKVGPRSDAFIVFDSPEAGSYIFHCRIAGHEKMRGVIVVE